MIEKSRKIFFMHSAILCLATALLAVIGGCSDGGAPPTVSALTDALGSAVEPTGSTGIFASSFTITFDKAMDEDSVTSDGAISLSCDNLPDGVGQPTIATTRADEGYRVFAIAVDDAYKYQLLSCTLTVTTSVKSSYGSELSNPSAYTFTNACATSDDFNIDSRECWTPQAVITIASLATWSLWDDILSNALAFDPASGSLVYDDTRNGEEGRRMFGLGKEVEISEDGFQLTIHFESTSGITQPELHDLAGVFIAKSLSYQYYYLGMAGSSNDIQLCAAIYLDFTGESTSTSSAAVCNNQEYYVRLTYTPDSVAAEASTDGEDWNELMPTGSTELTRMDDLSGSGAVTLTFLADEGTPHDNHSSIDAVVMSGITASGQY